MPKSRVHSRKHPDPSISQSVDSEGARRAGSMGQASKVREAILEAARALYAKGGYAGVTMRAIGEQLSIRAPSLYHHFDGKEQIFAELQNRGLIIMQGMMTQLLTRDPIDDVRKWYLRYYEFS